MTYFIQLDERFYMFLFLIQDDYIIFHVNWMYFPYFLSLTKSQYKRYNITVEDLTNWCYVEGWLVMTEECINKAQKSLCYKCNKYVKWVTQIIKSVPCSTTIILSSYWYPVLHMLFCGVPDFLLLYNSK